MTFCLLVVPADGAPELEAEVGESLFRIGRSPDCDLVLPSIAETVSAFHAEFRIQGGFLCVQDTDSRNGTFVDGQRITGWTKLRPGSSVRLGRHGPIIRWRRVAHRRAPDEEQVDANTATTRYAALQTWYVEHRQLVLGAALAVGIAVMLAMLLFLLL